MDFVQLRYFVCVTEEGNITRAAEKLHLTQPALSKALVRLSDELRVPLFFYHGRKIAPNENGKELYKWAKDVLENYDKLQKKLKKNMMQSNNTLVVAVSGRV